MEKARYNTELYSNLRAPLNNVKPSNFWGSHHKSERRFLLQGDSGVEDEVFCSVCVLQAMCVSLRTV